MTKLQDARALLQRLAEQTGQPVSLAEGHWWVTPCIALRRAEPWPKPQAYRVRCGCYWQDHEDNPWLCPKRRQRWEATPADWLRSTYGQLQLKLPEYLAASRPVRVTDEPTRPGPLEGVYVDVGNGTRVMVQTAFLRAARDVAGAYEWRAATSQRDGCPLMLGVAYGQAVAMFAPFAESNALPVRVSA